MSQILNPNEQKVIDKFEVIGNTDDYIRVKITLNSALQRELYEEIFKKHAQNIEIKGFRKGHAPRDMVEPKIYQQVMNEVISALVYQAAQEALQKLDDDILVVGAPVIDKINYTMIESPITIEMKLYVVPKFKLPDLKKYKVSPKDLEVKVTDEQIDQAIQGIFKQWKAQNKDAKIEKPTDEWAAKLGLEGVKNMKDLRDYIKKLIEKDMKLHAAQHKFEEIVMKILDDLNIKIPAEVVEKEVETILKQQEKDIERYGITLQQYLEYYKKDLESFKNEIRKSVETKYKLDLFWTVVLKEKGIKLEKEDADYIKLALSQFGVDVTQMNDPRILLEATRVAILLKAQDVLAKELGLGEIYRPLLKHQHVHAHGHSHGHGEGDHDHATHGHEHEDQENTKPKGKTTKPSKETKSDKKGKILIADE